MKRFEIEVEDTDYQLAKTILENMKFVKNVIDLPEQTGFQSITEHFHRITTLSVNREKIEELAKAMSGVYALQKFQMKYIGVESQADKMEAPFTVPSSHGDKNEAYLLSAVSLAEEWDSDEDQAYDQLYAASIAKREGR